MRNNADNTIWLADIVDSINLIESYTANLNKEDFFHSEEKQDAVVRRLGIIGEAVKNLPEDFKAQHKDVPWSKAAGMRNIIIHEYFDVDVDITWKVLKEHLPELKMQLNG
ncbi:MAG TPA: DUF86 domain-containing protein [Patescibacteria group bacterium]